MSPLSDKSNSRNIDSHKEKSLHVSEIRHSEQAGKIVVGKSKRPIAFLLQSGSLSFNKRLSYANVIPKLKTSNIDVTMVTETGNPYIQLKRTNPSFKLI
jgi:hypothetical protein